MTSDVSTKSLEHVFRVSVKGRLGKKRSVDATATVECLPHGRSSISGEEPVRVRIDCPDNLEFWCELEIPAEEIEEMVACYHQKWAAVHIHGVS